ncbi:hypothetical protein C8R46DRAFT_1050687 [Mycena filopes]|nr:hypothetical protein C8R46DRAFT_1050687 [Mycena filopes]
MIARKTRWDEEVHLLREEMRRVMRYLEWETTTWAERADGAAGEAGVGLSAELRAGKEAYARKQADMYRDLCTWFFAQLNVSLGDAAAASVLDDAEGGGLSAMFDEGADVSA